MGVCYLVMYVNLMTSCIIMTMAKQIECGFGNWKIARKMVLFCFLFYVRPTFILVVLPNQNSILYNNCTYGLNRWCLSILFNNESDSLLANIHGQCSLLILTAVIISRRNDPVH